MTMAGAAEQELERLREMFEQAPGAMAILRGSRHVIEMANAAYLELVGNRDVVGRPVAEALPEIEAQGFVELLDSVFRSGEPHVGKTVTVALRRAPQAALEERVLDFVYQPLKGSNGRVTGIFVEATDVTERVRAETALRKSEERYRYAFDSAAVSLWEEDCTDVLALIDGLRAAGVDDFRAHLDRHPELVREALRLVRVRDVNQEALRAFGARSKDELKASLGRTFTPSSFDVFKEELIALAEGRTSFAAEAELCTLAGEVRRFQIAAKFPSSRDDLDRVLLTLVDITERTRTEQALRDSEQRLRSVFAQTLSGIAETDLTGRFLRANPKFCEITGRSEQELLGLRMQDITHPDDLPRNLELFASLVRSEKSGFEIEKRYVRPDGSAVWIHNSVALVRDPHGQPQSSVAIALDISESRAVHEALRRSETRFRELIDTAPVGIAISEPNGTITRANDTLLKTLGLAREELEQGRMHWRSFTPPEYLHLDLEHLAELRRGGSPPPFEKELIRSDGSRVNVLVVARFLPEEGERTVAYALDLTASKRAEAAVLESEARLRSLIDNMTGFVAMLDREGTLLEVGAPALRVGGLRREDVIGRKFWECGWWLHDPEQQRSIEQWVAAAAQGATIREDVVARIAGDGRLAVDFMLAPVKGPDGTVTHVVPSGIDISMRKRMEMALREAAYALRDADRRKDEFLATLAHELRNPLAPIRNAVQLLKVAPQSAPQARDIIERQVQHMVRLVDDLLDVSRITLGQVNLKREELTLGAVLGEALESARPAIEAAGHSLHVDLPGEPLHVEGDATRLSQVFQNLLDNATKYTPRGGRISVSAERLGTEAVVSVSDSGLGIPSGMQDRIFELFTRSHSGGDVKIAGLGVGLALSRQLVELHSGRMSVESEGAGRGATFRVHLPLLAARTDTAPAGDVSSALEAGCDRRILVVDDNRDAASSLAMLLEISGCTVGVAFSGPQALELFESFRPDTVLLDIGMPEMDGYEVARRMRAAPRGAAVLLVALTGWGQEEDKRRAREAGFDEHLTKPVDQDRLSELFRAPR